MQNLKWYCASAAAPAKSKAQSAAKSKRGSMKLGGDDDDDDDQDDGGGVFAKRGEQRNYSGYWMSDYTDIDTRGSRLEWVDSLIDNPLMGEFGQLKLF